MATPAQIAAAFLDSIGAPNTPEMRLAVTAWLRSESGGTVIGGNPWNITYPAALEIARKGGPKPLGYRVHSITGMKFAVYSSSIEGAKASGKLLTGAGNDWRNYDGIITAARRNDPIGFLNALARSAWDAGRYGTKSGGTNKLLGIYRNLGGSLGTVTERGAAVVGGSKLTRDDFVTALITLGISTDDSYRLTDADTAKLTSYFSAKGISLAGTGIGKGSIVLLIKQSLGQPNSFFPGATEAINSETASIGNIAGTLSTVAGAILDPGNWVRILALLVGGALVAYGGVSVARAAA